MLVVSFCGFTGFIKIHGTIGGFSDIPRMSGDFISGFPGGGFLLTLFILQVFEFDLTADFGLNTGDLSLNP